MLLQACAFKTPADVEIDADPRDAEPIDAVPPDAAPCVADTTVCDDDSGVYTACGSDGLAESVIACPLGCASGVEKCLDVAPSNDLAEYLDQSDVTPAVSLTGNCTIDTSVGSIHCDGEALQAATALVNGPNGMRVFLFGALDISGTVKVTGTASLVLISNGDVVLGGLLDVSADLDIGGPGAQADGAACEGGDSLDTSNPTSGGGGAGRYELGGVGGMSGAAEAGGARGAIYRDDDLTPLRGGCHGGRATELVGMFGQSSTGGGGGGAVQIVSRTRIRVSGSGKIDASGGGGRAAASSATCAGAGGGSGGAILLEAPIVELDGSGVVLSTKGGGGSAVSANLSTTHGADGGTTPSPAAGGVGSISSGGAGGTETTSPGSGTSGGSSGVDGTGGGGAVGQVRLNTLGGTFTPSGNAVIRSQYSTDFLQTRLVP